MERSQGEPFTLEPNGTIPRGTVYTQAKWNGPKGNCLHPSQMERSQGEPFTLEPNGTIPRGTVYTQATWNDPKGNRLHSSQMERSQGEPFTLQPHGTIPRGTVPGTNGPCFYTRTFGTAIRTHLSPLKERFQCRWAEPDGTISKENGYEMRDDSVVRFITSRAK